MRLAYSISGYKLPNQFRWLMEAIWHPDDVFAVHIDAKTPASVFEAFRAAGAGRSNVRFVSREPVVWMGGGLVRAELRAMDTLLRMAPDFSHLVSLSAQDYPLRPRDEIVAALAAEPDLNHITCVPLRDLPFHVRRRPYFVCFEWGSRLIKTPFTRPIPPNLGIAWKGSWWRVMTRDFCTWVLTAPETRSYWRFLRHVQAPDELFFQNLVMASPYRERVARNRHFVVWPGDSGSPLTLTSAHKERLLTSDLWFARKFDETVDRSILETLAARIGAPVPPFAREAA